MNEKLKELFRERDKIKLDWEMWVITDRQYAERLLGITERLEKELQNG